MRFGHNFWLGGPIDARSTRLNCILQDLSRDTPLDHIWRTQIRSQICQIWPNMPNMVFGAHIWARQIWSSRVSPKRSCKMQFRCDGFIFGPIALKRIEHGVSISYSMFYLFPSDRTKNEKMLFFCNTAFSSQQNLKRGSTSAARNSALKTILPLYEHFEIREFLGLSWQY